MRATFLVFCVFIVNCSNAQYISSPKEITIQNVKENAKIDSLMKVIIKHIDRSERNFCFEIAGQNNDFIFRIFQIPKTSSGISFPSLKLEEFTYFDWNGFTIFVVEDKNPFNFFKKNDKWKSFSVSTSPVDIASLPPSHFTGLFRYEKGQFQFEDIAIH